MATLTKIIKQGNSQALRIPAAFRLPSKEVEIYRTGGGLLIIDPVEREKTLAAFRNFRAKPRAARKKK